MLAAVESVGVGPLLAVAAAVVAAVQLVRLALADADLTLLSKGLHKPDAYKGKVCWVVGASQGLGEVLAHYLSTQGARVILSSRRQAVLEEVAAKCTELGAQDTHVLPLDLCGSFEELDAVCDSATQAFDGAGLDYVFFNAGASQSSMAVETSHKVAEALFEINALGPIKLARAVTPKLLSAGRGRLVLVASMAGKVPSPGQSLYSAAKMGVYGYFASLNTEIADRNVGVTVCCPGPVAGGTEEKPRMVWGAEGTQPSFGGESKSRVKPDRCAALMASAAAHGLDEAWIAKHPILLMAYLRQYLPGLAWLVLKKVGPKRARNLSTGKSGYDISSLTTNKED